MIALNEPPSGHHIKGRPSEGEGYCTCGYGTNDNDFDSMEEHIAKVVLIALRAAVKGLDAEWVADEFGVMHSPYVLRAAVMRLTDAENK